MNTIDILWLALSRSRLQGNTAILIEALKNAPRCIMVVGTYTQAISIEQDNSSLRGRVISLDQLNDAMRGQDCPVVFDHTALALIMERIKKETKEEICLSLFNTLKQAIM